MNVIARLSEKPELLLVTDANNWIVCEGLRFSVRRNGKQTASPLRPAYYGLNLGAALAGALRRIVHLKAKPGMGLEGVAELATAAHSDLSRFLDTKADSLRKAVVQPISAGSHVGGE